MSAASYKGVNLHHKPAIHGNLINAIKKLIAAKRTIALCCGFFFLLKPSSILPVVITSLVASSIGAQLVEERSRL
jgi:hypothetical protein